MSSATNMIPKRLSARSLCFAASVVLVVTTLYYLALPDSYSPAPHWAPAPPIQDESSALPDVWEDRAEQVKRAFLHAYRGWETHAAPHDELLPLTNRSSDKFNGWGVTMYDSLDTMILMGLHDEFERALPMIEQANFSLLSLEKSKDRKGRPVPQHAPFFETVIRYLGGLLSAYALSHEPILLQRADDLGRLLAPAFNTTSGFPKYAVNTDTGGVTGSNTGILAEIASCQLEYTFLAQLTGSKEHFDKADRVIQALAQADVTRRGGMFPMRWNLVAGQPMDDILSVGAAADSAHEYLLKQWLLTGQTDDANLQMYLRTTNHILTHLLYLSDDRELLYVTDTSSTAFLPSHKMEHLSCFLPGLLALGAHTLGDRFAALDVPALGTEGLRSHRALEAHDLRSLHLWAAEGLATTCYLMYADQASGLAPDEVTMRPRPKELGVLRFAAGFAGGGAEGGPAGGGRGELWIDAMKRWKDGGAEGAPPGVGMKYPKRYTMDGALAKETDYYTRRDEYFLRPETVESFYIMWRVTGNPIWRERGWEIFESIERETKTDSGYASVKDLYLSPATQKDDMPSYFLAETLKYLYLLFHEDDLVPLDKWVFNTEAHPFPIFTWSDWERRKFGIAKPSS
ncbi:seven-hairpin glycosidase [Obba rivulosa]|uniref:alpha-1,2-Mannosidase n=1 Tax=Obba rivulosa TaxID=1052685 RepID=A0A8E2ASU9_9APHY|nr:seven-hairpin glycosidase [Obba rivulosa]